MCEVKTRSHQRNSRSILDTEEDESLGESRRVACNFEQFDYQQFDEIKIENIDSVGFKICSQSPGGDQQSRKIIIHSIDCENFKSFFGKITLGPFGPGMSCIIGPNGSGKSNVIDSLLFVFGYRASKIRSRKLAVLIHNSSKEEHCRFASVTVNFHIFNSSKPQDLSNKQSNTECNGEYFEKLSVKRVVQQNSSSSYFINDCPSSYRQVTDVLKKYEIDLLNSRFLILQGEVEQISQMKPKRQPGDTHDGMLEYIEEIIGTNILAEPIKTYESRLNLLKEYEGFLTNQKNNVELELGQLEGRKDEVLKFIELENQTNSLKFYKFHRQLQTQIQSLESKKIESDARKDRSKDANQQLVEINMKIKEKGKLKAQYQSQCSKIQSSLREWHKKFSNCEARDAKLQTMLRHYETEESNCSRKVEEMKKELEDNCCIDEQKINEKAEKLKQLIEMTDKSIETCRSHLDAALENFEKETRPLQRTKEEEMKKCTPLQDKSNEIKIKAAACMNELNRLQSERDSLIKDIVDRKEECMRLRTVDENINTDIKNCESELEKYENGLAKVLNDIGNLGIQINQIRNEIGEKNEILAQQQSLTSGSSASIELKKLLEFLLDQHRKGEIEGKIYGRLGDFLITEQKFNIAVSTCSSRFDNIVVDRVDTAIQCVNLMKKHSAGTASFICLDKMSKVPPINLQNQDKVDGVPIFHVVECLEKEVLPAAYFAIGNAILASDLSVAQKLAFGTSNSKSSAAGKRVITLEGQIIEPSGVMSGGGQALRNKILIHKKSNQNNESNLTVLGGNSVMILSNNELSAIKLSLEGLIEKLSSLQLNLRNMEKVKGECDTKIAQLTPKLQKLNKQKADPMSSKSLEIAESKLKALELQFEEFKREKFSLIEETEARHKKLSVSLQKALDKLSEQKQEHDRISAELQAMQSKLLDPLRVDLEKKEKLQIEQKVELNKCNIKEARLEFDSLSKKIDEAVKKHQELLSKYESTGAEIKENEKKALEASQAIQALDSELKEIEVNFSNSKKSDDDSDNEENLDKIALNLRAEIKKLNEEMSTCNNEMIKLKCNIEKLQLSIASLFLNNLETADRQVLCEEDKQRLLTDSSAQYNLDCPLNELEDRISKCSSELEKMPMPNITVLEEFRKCKTRFEDKQQLLAHHLEVSNAQKKLRDSLKDLRLLVFNKSLVLLNRHLKLLYNAITMGGTAELEVVDVISPFAQGLQLTVMPPNKAWKVIGNLSGGEKTLSSLALLFSLHALRPAPFYILDEIDAALDFRNVAIIASYLKWQAERNTQFLVISLREHMYSNAERFVAVYKYADKSKTLAVRNIDLEDDNCSKKLVM